MRTFLIFFSFFLFHFIYAQNLTGVWRGTLISSNGVVSTDNFEMQILQEKYFFRSLITYKYHHDADLDGDNANMKAIIMAVLSDDFADESECGCKLLPGSKVENFSSSGKDIRITENKHILCNASENHKLCNYLNYNLKWHKKGIEEYLSGKVFSVTDFIGYSGTLTMKKVNKITPAQSFFIKKNTFKKVPKLNAITSNFKIEADPISLKKYIPIPDDIKYRENELLKTVVVKGSKVNISIYDYGKIDHDRVSVYIDKKLVIFNKELTKNPLNIKLDIDKLLKYREVILVAENLGDIPPNTALMKIKAGNKKYEIKIMSTEQKNAVILFKHEE